MTRKLTAAQATIQFLKQQYVERDGAQQQFFAGCFGIFGHGNVAGIGQAQATPIGPSNCPGPTPDSPHVRTKVNRSVPLVKNSPQA